MNSLIIKFLLSFFILNSFWFISACGSFSRFFENSGHQFKVVIETDETEGTEEQGFSGIVDRAMKATQFKINALDLKGEVIRDPSNENQILVKVYGSNDWEKLKKFLFTTYRLELKKAISPPNPTPLGTYPTREAAEENISKSSENLPAVEILPYTERGGETSNFVIVEKSAIINGEDIRNAQANPVPGSEEFFNIYFVLKPEGAIKFGDWTGKNIGNYLAIVLDKKVVSVAFIKSQITDSGQIDGRFSEEQAENIAISLKSGYIPATMKVIEETAFGN